MDHKAQQAEYRRLKAERKARVLADEQKRKDRIAFKNLQKKVLLSHDDLLGLITEGWFHVPDDLKILSISPVEGGWCINMIEEKHYYDKPRGVGEGDVGVE